ncbi:MAG: STAS domain-containing protein [Microthrixaceae bacterium]
MQFHWSWEPRGDRVVLRIEGEVDLASAPRFRAALIDAIDEIDPDSRSPELVVDLTRCALLDSVGIGLLFGAARRVASCHASLVVVADGTVRKLLALTGADRALRVVGPSGSDSHRD